MLLKKEIYNAKIEIIEDMIIDITDLTTNTTLNAKTNKVENEIRNITNLATITTALATDENKIPDHSKYSTTREFNKLTTEKFCFKITTNKFNKNKQNVIANFVKKTDFKNINNFNFKDKNFKQKKKKKKK